MTQDYPWLTGLSFAARWRYIGPVDVDSSSSNPQLNGAFQPGFGHIGGYDYIDLSAAISWGAHMSFRIGVNNVTDKPPPIVLNGNLSNCPNTSCNDNTGWAPTTPWAVTSSCTSARSSDRSTSLCAN